MVQFPNGLYLPWIGFLFFFLNFTLLCARPVEKALQDEMSLALEQDYDNLAQLWYIANEYYLAEYNVDSVECI